MGFLHFIMSIKFDKRYSLNDKFKLLLIQIATKKGDLNYGELILHGKSKQEI